MDWQGSKIPISALVKIYANPNGFFLGHQKQNSSLEPKRVNLAHSIIDEPEKHFFQFFLVFFIRPLRKRGSNRDVTRCEGGETINAADLKRNLIFR